MNIQLRRKQPIQRISTRSKIITTLIVCGGFVLFGLQIWLSGQIATAGQQIRDYENEKEKLLAENAALNEQFNTISSLEYIEEKAKEMGFVRVQPGAIEFISSLDSFASLIRQ